MPQKPVESERKIELEELLRLKRHERPDEQFWGRFDRELHQRMLQTLMKKDPWYVQVMRGLSGRIAQSSAIMAAALALGFVLLRPAFDGTFDAPGSIETAALYERADRAEVVSGEAVLRELSADAAAVEVAMADLSYAEAAGQVRAKDYKIDAIAADSDRPQGSFKRDFQMDAIYSVAVNSGDYSTDSALARPGFGAAGVASLVY